MIRCAVDAREYSLPNRPTGVGRFLTNIVGPLAAGEEFEFHLLTSAPDSVPSKLLGLPGVKVQKLPKLQSLWLDQRILPRVAREIQADLFFSPYHKGLFFPHLPLIITVHDIMFLRLRALTPWARLLARLQLQITINHCNKVIAVSRFTERDLIDMFPPAAEKTVVMYSDIGTDWFTLLTDHSSQPAPSILPQSFGRYFLYVGNFKPHKNVDLLIKACHSAWQSGKLAGHHLVLIGGDDDNLSRIQKLIKRLDLEGRIFICRDIDDFSLSRFYQAADWFITASEYEGFGYPAVEAMIAGCPVICHQTTSLIEVAGSAALPITALTAPEVAMSMIRASQMTAAERAEYIEYGRRQARMFTPGQTATAFARLCRNLVSRKRETVSERRKPETSD